MRFCFFCLLSIAVSSVCVLGCDFGRHSIEPGVNQVVRVESGDRLFFELEENATTGYQWRYTCDDSDVSVIIDHRGPKSHGELAGAPGSAKVTIRIHRGYDGPSTITFRYHRSWEKDVAPAKEFVVTLYKRTGDCAFWE